MFLISLKQAPSPHFTPVSHSVPSFSHLRTQVTVFGQSSGGTAIHALLASPLASGLFHRAWLSSPSAILNKTSAQASRDNLVFLNLTGCADAACLRALSAQDVMAGTPWTEFPHWAMKDVFSMPVPGRFGGALPVVDGGWWMRRCGDLKVVSEGLVLCCCGEGDFKRAVLN